MQNANAELSESATIALAHLGMLSQIANGTHRPQPGEIDKRTALIVSFIRTGQCVASDEDRAMVQAIKEFTKQPEAPKREAVG
jgi:hypothetical protein